MTATSPVHSSEDEDDDEDDEEGPTTTDNDETGKQQQTDPTAAAQTPLSPMSVVSEQSSPELIEPPRKLEKNAEESRKLDSPRRTNDSTIDPEKPPEDILKGYHGG